LTKKSDLRIPDPYLFSMEKKYDHRIGWWENLQETPIFDGKKPWLPVDFPLNQSFDMKVFKKIQIDQIKGGAPKREHAKNYGVW
jgi:hypothetical protein